MPELPEVETVARDLRPRILGATITGARVSWARTLRTHTPEAFGEAIAGRRVEAVWRRAKQIVIDLSGDAALTIHLKMTGQLFVVPAETPVDPYVRLVLELADGREIRFRDIRKFGKIGLYGRDPGHGRVGDRGRWRRGLREARPGAARPGVLGPRFPAPAAAAVGPAQAAPARPVVHRRGRQHLRRRGALGGPTPPAPDGRHAASQPTSGTCTTRSGGSWPRPSCAAEARSTTTPRRTVMARCRSTCRSTSAPANRARAAGDRSSASSSGRDRPTSARGASGWAPATARARPRSSER